MDFLAITKKAVSVVVGIGVSKIVADVIANNVEIEKAHHQVAVPVAAIAIGGVVADASSAYTDTAIDQIAELWNELFNKTANKD